jgi:putative MATE family efflux protein
MVKDLTTGKPMKLILGFLVPVLFGCLFQQFYTVVDTIIVGRYLGVDALASVGSTGSVNFLIVGFCMGICSGFAIPVSQKFGAKDYKRMREYVANLTSLCALFAVCMTLLTVICCRPILTLMRTPEDIIDGAVTYIRIIFLGIPLTMLYNTVSGLIRAVGDSKTPVYFLLLSSVLNIFLDLFLILVIPMGVAGAAWATVISQGISGFACLIYMKKKFPILTPKEDEKKTNTAHWKTLCANGIPMGLQYSITAIGSVILQTSVNMLGSSAVASVTAGSRISMFFCAPFDAMGTTMATYGGQNTGAGELKRLKAGLRDCSLMALGYSIAAFFIMYYFGGKLSLLFVDESSTEIINNAHFFLIANSLFYFPLAWVNIYRLMIQGMGFSRLAIFSGVFEMVARIVVAVYAVPIWKFPAACFASPVAWVAADCFLIPAFLHCYKKLEHIHQEYQKKVTDR